MGAADLGHPPGRSSGDEARELCRWWDGLGTDAGRLWAASGRDPDGFPQLATQLLLDRPQPTQDPVGAALRWMAESPLPPQHNPGTGFGQPAVTVYRGEGFLVYLLFWFEETVTVHDHRFSGAFSILAGVSLHTVYRFQPRERLSVGLESGALDCVTVETLAPGDVRPIAEGRGLIHSNFHFGLPAPTLSVVVRTEVDWQRPQHLYAHSGLSFTDGTSDAGAGKRRQGLVAASRVSPGAGLDYLRRALAQAPPEEAMSHLNTAASMFAAATLSPLIVSSPLGSSDDLSGRAIRHLHQVQAGLVALHELAQLTDPGDRLLMAMVAAGTDWAHVDGTVLGPRELPRAALSRLVVALVERAGTGGVPSRCSLSPAALELARRLGAAAPPSSPEEPAYRELATHRVLGTLFRHLLAGA